jgi:hypothetical protein
MAGAAILLKTLSEEAHEPFDENLAKAEASKRIDELQRKLVGASAEADRIKKGAIDKSPP